MIRCNPGIFQNLYNPIAARIVQILKNTWITPNHVTYVSIFVGLISAYIYSIGTVQAFFFAVFC
jgi:hypothetical protein